MLVFFINITGLFSGVGAAMSAGPSMAGGIMQARAERHNAECARQMALRARENTPLTPTTIPKVASNPRA
ncbi:MAG: hypothetical protein ACRC14_02125 [Paracoccaceae bacterium]